MAAAECDDTIVPSSLLMLTSDHQTDFAPGGPWDLGVEGFGLLAASQVYDSASTHKTATGAEGHTVSN